MAGGAVQAEAWGVEHKADASPLTRADKDANAVICDGLAQIGERSKQALVPCGTK